MRFSFFKLKHKHVRRHGLARSIYANPTCLEELPIKATTLVGMVLLKNATRVKILLELIVVIP